MQAQLRPETQVETQEPVPSQEVEGKPRWNPATRIAFRFAFAYLALYTLPFPLNYIPYVGGFISQKYMAMWGPVVSWVGRHIFHVNAGPPSPLAGGGDFTYAFVVVFCCLVLAAVVTVVWSVLDRKRPSYPKLHAWFRVSIRLWLALFLFSYGMVKVIPNQMPAPSASRLLQPFGDSNPMSVLWSFMGVSPVYQSITGCVEVLGGLLLLLPRTTTLGALVSAMAMVQVWLLNMCYGVPVKQFSFHLLLASLFLLAPEIRRLANLLVLNRVVEPAPSTALFRRRWLNWGIVAAQVAFGMYLLIPGISYNIDRYYTSGIGAPKVPLYGIWNVEEFTVDGEVKPPLLTDQGRWRRLTVDQFNSVVQGMNERSLPYRVQIDPEKKTVNLVKYSDPNAKMELAYEESQPGQLTISGELDGKRMQAKLVRYDESKFFLESRGFHWIQERPVNR